jgi:protein-cysteine N-palmitoyltransferase HHAT
MNPGDVVIQMQQSPRSQLEAITGESDPDKSPCRGGITRVTVDVPSTRPSGETRPPRWRTPEFLLYYVIFAIAVPWMIYTPIELSASTSFLSSHYIVLLRPYGIQRQIRTMGFIDIG